MRLGLAFSGGMYLTAGALANAVVGLGAQLILMRLLMPDVFGHFATTYAMCGLVQLILNLRLNALIIRTPAMPPERAELFRAAMIWETAGATVVTLAWLGSSGQLDSFTALLVGSVGLGHWCNQQVAFHERGMAYGPIAAVEAGSQITGHMVAVAMALAGLGASALYVRELVTALVRLAAFARIGALARPICRLPKAAEIRALAREARGLWADGVLENGLARLVVLGAAAVVGPYGAGIFTQSQRLALIPHQLVSPVAGRLSINLFSREDDGARRLALLRRLTLLVLLGLGLGAGATLMLAEWAIPLVLGEHWRPAASALKAMAGVLVFYSAFDLVKTYCIAQHRMRLLLAARLCQYAVFLSALALAALGADQPLLVLALGLSATYVLSFAAVWGGLARRSL